MDINIDWKTGKSPRAFAGKMAAFKRRLDDELEAAMQDAVTWVEADAKERASVENPCLGNCPMVTQELTVPVPWQIHGEGVRRPRNAPAAIP